MKLTTAHQRRSGLGGKAAARPAPPTSLMEGPVGSTGRGRPPHGVGGNGLASEPQPATGQLWSLGTRLGISGPQFLPVKHRTRPQPAEAEPGANLPGHTGLNRSLSAVGGGGRPGAAPAVRARPPSRWQGPCVAPRAPTVGGAQLTVKASPLLGPAESPRGLPPLTLGGRMRPAHLCSPPPATGAEKAPRSW